MSEIKLERRVVCAVNRYRSFILLGPRHWDATMRKQKSEMDLLEVASEHFEQGFINTWGDFLTREEAWMAASHNNQIFRFVGSQLATDVGIAGTQLYSENLY